MSDFAIHDQTMDLLQVLQTQRMASVDLQKLNERLTAQRARLREQEAHSRKLALVAAVGRDPAAPSITLDDAEWAIGFVRRFARNTIRAVGSLPRSRRM